MSRTVATAAVTPAVVFPPVNVSVAGVNVPYDTERVTVVGPVNVIVSADPVVPASVYEYVTYPSASETRFDDFIPALPFTVLIH